MSSIIYNGDSQTVEFVFRFAFWTYADICVQINGKIINTGYEIIPTQNTMPADIPYTGGTVRFNIAPKTTDVIKISRDIQLDRIVDYQPTEKIDPENLNQDLCFMIETLKDFKGKLIGYETQYNNLINMETGDDLIRKVDQILSELDRLAQLDELGQDVDAIQTVIQDWMTTMSLLKTLNLGNLQTVCAANTDYVIEYQAPNADNSYKWYRKYKSGWVEQGGLHTTTTTEVELITLPVIMADANYTLQCSCNSDSNMCCSPNYKLVNCFRAGAKYLLDARYRSDITMAWTVRGFAAA